MLDAASIDDLADRFAMALASGDIPALDRLLAPDFAIWYNFSDASLERAQALAFFADYFTRVRVDFRDIIRHPTANGWVQQHRVDADGPDGFKIRGMPACLVVILSDGLISHISEYFDSAWITDFDRSLMDG